MVASGLDLPKPLATGVQVEALGSLACYTGSTAVYRVFPSGSRGF